MKISKNFKKYIKVISFSCIIFLVLSCSQVAVYPEPRILVSTVEQAKPKEDNFKTHTTTKLLSLEAPLRCNVAIDNQKLIKTIPYDDKAFVLKRADINNQLPKYQVEGFSFNKMEASKAITKLAKEIDIRVIARDEPYLEMSAEGLKGELSEIVEMITDASDVFYNYDRKHKVLELKRRASFKLMMPENDFVILAALDAMRGANINNIVVDWEDKALLFDADKKTIRKVERMIEAFDNEPSLLAFDIAVYRFYPTKGLKEIQWQDIPKVFGRDKIKATINGVIGRMAVTAPEINHEFLIEFMNNYGAATKLSEGVLVVPNKWKSRFDVGRCGRADVGEADLSILAESLILPNRRIEAQITLDTSGGEIARFNPKNRLGENYLIIGLPTKMLDPLAQDAETIVLMTPRLIKVVQKEQAKTTEAEPEQNWSGDWLMNLIGK